MKNVRANVGCKAACACAAARLQRWLLSDTSTRLLVQKLMSLSGHLETVRSIGGPVAAQHEPKWKNAEKNAVRQIHAFVVQSRCVMFPHALSEWRAANESRHLLKYPLFALISGSVDDIDSLCRYVEFGES